MYVTTFIGILYGIYVLLVLTLMSLFIFAVTHPKKITLRTEVPIAVWIVFLVAIAVFFHIATYFRLPWVKWEIMGKKLLVSREFKIDVRDYKFYLPENPILIKVNEPVRFTLTSQDVTYGFGIFRSDGTLVFQIQVVPGHSNEIAWIFHKAGKYTIRSTEYSGPENWKMVLKDTIVVKDKEER